MKKRSTLLILSIATLFVALTISAQTPSPGSSQPASQLGASQNGQQPDEFSGVHKGIFTTSDKANAVGQFTDDVAKSLPDAVPISGPVPRKNFIDEHIFGRIEKDGIPRAGFSADEEFVRRVYLDATGMLPSSDAVRAYVASTDPAKGDKLIDSLIGTEEFSEQWAWFFGDLFRLMNYAGDLKNAFQFWNKEWLKIDRPYNDVVTDLLTGAAKDHSAIPQMGFLGRIVRSSGLKNRDLTDPDNYGATGNRLDAIDEFNVEIGRAFLGINAECISCHDGAGHLEAINMYLSERTRKEFSSQAAFFGRFRVIGLYNNGASNNIYDDDAPGYTTGKDAPFHTESESRFPRTGDTYEPVFMLTGEKPRPGVNPRAELARMLTTNPQFDRAAVNLIWGKLMTVGFVEPWDGFDLARLDPKNPPPKPWKVQPNNPELLEALAADFRDHNHSMQRLMKTIMKSNAYRLSSQFPGEWKDAYTSYYARKYVRVMTGPEVIDSLGQASGRMYNFDFQGTQVERVKQLTDLKDVPVEKGGNTSNFGVVAGKSEGTDIINIMSSFFETDRLIAVPIGNRATTLQAMLMMRSGVVNNRVVAEPGSKLRMLLDWGKTDEDIIQEMYLSSLSRWPTASEKKVILEEFQKDRKKGAENLQWAIVNSSEFLLNH